MQVTCQVNIVNRLLPSTGQAGPSRLARYSITLAETSPKSGVVELSLFSAQKKATVAKYRVTNNVEKVFSKFACEGKLTLRFKQPPHDLCLNGQKNEIERILNVIQGNDDQVKKGTLCPLLTNKIVVQKLKLNITSRADYPVTTAFPVTLVSLKITGIALKKFDRRILNLHSLEILDLSNNQISCLPENISTMKKLKQLILSRNEIKLLPRTFLNSVKAITLDFSHNEIGLLPSCISRVSGLHTLKLDHNKISFLPGTISKLKNLRTLTVSENRITTLPVSFHTLNLDHIDLHGNPFDRNRSVSGTPATSLIRQLPTLVAIAAKATIKLKLKYGEGDIPSTLITYLHESSTFCPCGKLCLEDGIPSVGLIDLLRVSDSISGDRIVPLELTLCSSSCFQRFSCKVIT